MNRRINDNLPTLCFAAPHVGEYSEVWLWRLMLGCKRLRTHVLTWKYLNRDTFHDDMLEICVLPFHPRPAEQEGVRRWIHRMRSLPKFNFYASAGAEYQAIVNWLGQVHPQVILGQTGHTSLKLLPIARSLDTDCSAFPSHNLSSGLRNRWYRWSLMHELSGFDAVIVVGSHQRQWMIQHKVPAEKIHLIPCGVPTQLFTPVPRPPSGRVVFLAVSRLVEKKGVEYTLRACRHSLRNATT